MNSIKEHYILAINPGSTSTKFAVYVNEACVLNKTLRHSVDELSAYADIIEQFGYRKGMIIDALVEEKIDIDRIKHIIGRGGLTYPLESGVYLVDQLMLKHARDGVYGKHASNLGPIIADYIASQIPGAHAYRITSYNVCYTKLLRCSPHELLPTIPPIQQRLAVDVSGPNCKPWGAKN